MKKLTTVKFKNFGDKIDSNLRIPRRW